MKSADTTDAPDTSAHKTGLPSADTPANAELAAWIRAYLTAELRKLESRLTFTPDVTAIDDRLLTDPLVAKRYNVSARTIQRWDSQPELHFPAPLLVNGKKYRRLSALQKWERLRAALQRNKPPKHAP
jgi:hypothetical protein